MSVWERPEVQEVLRLRLSLRKPWRLRPRQRRRRQRRDVAGQDLSEALWKLDRRPPPPGGDRNGPNQLQRTGRTVSSGVPHPDRGPAARRPPRVAPAPAQRQSSRSRSSRRPVRPGGAVVSGNTTEALQCGRACDDRRPGVRQLRKSSDWGWRRRARSELLTPAPSRSFESLAWTVACVSLRHGRVQGLLVEAAGIGNSEKRRPKPP